MRWGFPWSGHVVSCRASRAWVSRMCFSASSVLFGASSIGSTGRQESLIQSRHPSAVVDLDRRRIPDANACSDRRAALVPAWRRNEPWAVRTGRPLLLRLGQCTRLCILSQPKNLLKIRPSGVPLVLGSAVGKASIGVADLLQWTRTTTLEYFLNLGVSTAVLTSSVPPEARAARSPLRSGSGE